MVEFANISKDYEVGDTVIHALRPATFAVPDGSFLTVMGPSGSGKSTMLNLFGLLIQPTTGTYSIDGKTVSSLSDDETSNIRNRTIGIVFQSFNLLPHLTILENVCLPMQYALQERGASRARAKALLDQFGLAGRYSSRPTQLSGGQCQRVAIARSLANDPPVILADEPTGNLDEKTGKEVMRIFSELHRDVGKTIIMVTHNPSYGQYATHRIAIHDGTVTFS
ncbi:MAG: ABC transporter ATP-binding protein [Kiritimatiellaeota bacterium]|nr:ABC transporter ATP-binding protein [Kiritimatiellota bacterium]